MNAKEIRDTNWEVTASLREIAAQLAELTEVLKSFDYKEGTRIFDVRPREL